MEHQYSRLAAIPNQTYLRNLADYRCRQVAGFDSVSGQNKMNIDPLSVALVEIAETKNLLDGLITSSESFDYVKAKNVLKALNRKLRDLGKLQTKYERLLGSRGPNTCEIGFKANPAATAQISQP